MPTIVVHRPSGQLYVLVGTGYAATESATPGLFLGNLSPDVETKSYGMVAVCDGEGIISWGDSRSFAVIEVDGNPPSRILERPPYR
jgi:hypothetical protein